jgi:signal transduction histidine kinase
MKQAQRRFLSLILCLCVILITAAPCCAKSAAKKTLKVAYYHMGQYFATDSTGNMQSYDAEYLNKIAEYCDYTFEYVDCGTWDHALKMLRNHEVDLVGTAQWTREREEQYEFCLENYGYTIGELVARDDSPILYEDYDRIGESTIGYTDTYVRKAELTDLLEQHDVEPQLKTYPDQAALEQALMSGEIDLAALNIHTLPEHIKTIERFTYAPFYFISWKGNTELTDAIDNALIRINLEWPNFDDEILSKYFPTLSGVPLSKAEEDLIACGKTYTIFFDGATKPLVWYDAESQEMAGALVEICRQITEITGLKLEVVYDQDRYEGANSTIFAPIYYNSSVSVNQENNVSKSILDEAFNLFYCVRRNDLDSTENSVGIVGTRPAFHEYIAEKYPGYQIMTYDSPADCLKHLERGDVKFAFLDKRIAQDAIVSLNLNDIAEMPLAEQTIGMAIRFHDEDAALLTSIVTKSLYSVDYNAVNEMFVQTALSTSPQMTVKSVIEDHLGLVAAAVGLLLLLLVSLTYAFVMHRQNRLVEQANRDRSDFFSRMSHDMRTPMNGVIGMARLSRDETDPERLRANMAKVEESGEYLLGLINDSLDLQKIESQHLQLTPVIVGTQELVSSITNMVRITAEKKNIRFEVINVSHDSEVYVRCDAQRIRQIFVNLLSNAVKFTPDGGSVQFRFENLGVSGSTLREKIEVIDSGICFR